MARATMYPDSAPDWENVMWSMKTNAGTGVSRDKHSAQTESKRLPTHSRLTSLCLVPKKPGSISIQEHHACSTQ